MPSEIAKHNLEKDKRVQGKDWFSTYGNYFADEENIASFVQTIKSHLPDKELTILYAGSASGLLGERLLSNLGKGSLTLVDMSQEHLNANTNPNTEKILGDLLELDLGRKFDLILMRSSLDYFPTRALQVQVLKIIKSHLQDGGVLINQPAYISDVHERDLISGAYNAGDKIGKRLFQSTDIGSLYEAAGLEQPVKIGDGKIMYLTEKDHIKRYGLNPDDVAVIQGILKGAVQNAQVTKDGYSMKFEFPIFLARASEGNGQ